MTKRILLLGLIGSLVGSAGCGSGEEESGRGSGASAEGSAMARGSREAVRSDPSPPVIANRGVALGWLPSETVMAVRLPSLDVKSIWTQTAFVQNADAWLPEELRETLGFLWDRAMNDGGAPPTWLLEAFHTMGALDGECVVAMVFHPTLLGRGVPLSGVAYVDLQGRSDEITEWLDATVLENTRPEELRRLASGTYALLRDEVCLEIEIRDGWASLHVGPSAVVGGTARGWRAQDQGESLLAARVVTDAPSGTADAEVYFEGFVNLQALWPVARRGPPPVPELMERLVLEDLHGFSWVASVAGGEFVDQWTLHSRSHRDILSILCDQPALETDRLPRGFAGSDSYVALSVDPQRIVDAVERALPESLRQTAAGAWSEARQDLGIPGDVSVASAFGPQLVLATKGNLLGAVTAQQNFAATLSIQVRDREAARTFVGSLVAGAAIPMETRMVSGVSCQVSTASIPDAPWCVPTFGFVGDSLIVATSPEVFAAQVATQGKDPDGALGRHLRALPDATWFTSCSDSAAQLVGLSSMLVAVTEQIRKLPPFRETASLVGLPAPELERHSGVGRDIRWSPSTTTAYPTDVGMRWESRSPLPPLGMGVVPLGIAAAVAIPNFTSARLKANESAATATLRNLASAQVQFQVVAAADRDGDEAGEFGFLGELSGAVPLPSGDRLDPPMLSARFQGVVHGIVERSGYCFAIYLPRRGGGYLAEGEPGEVDPDRSEREWIAVAWPTEAGETGSRAYAITHRLDLLTPLPSSPVFSGRDQKPTPEQIADWVVIER